MQRFSLLNKMQYNNTTILLMALTNMKAFIFAA